MSERYSINPIHICTFEKFENGIRPNLEEFPDVRLCVIDHELNKAIDVEHELQYDYLETMSSLYFINESSKKLKENKRAAIIPVVLLNCSVEELNKAKTIIEKLEVGYKFDDGNEELSNEEYLKRISEEKINKNSNKKKNKIKIFGRK